MTYRHRTPHLCPGKLPPLLQNPPITVDSRLGVLMLTTTLGTNGLDNPAGLKNPADKDTMLFSPSLPMEQWRLRFTASASLPRWKWPASMLRGAFGHALRGHCLCPEQPGQCPYHHIFEPGPSPLGKRYQTPSAYVISAPANTGGNSLTFTFTLLPDALAHRDLLWQCWQQAAVHGLGPKKVRCQPALLEVQQAPSPLPLSAGFEMEFFTPVLLKRRQPGTAASLRLKANEAGVHDVLVALHRRMTLLAHPHGMAPPALQTWLQASAHWEVTSRWQEQHFGRGSARQKAFIPQYGLLGQIQVRGTVPNDLAQALLLGQWLHLGAKTALGQGAYTLRPLDDQADTSAHETTMSTGL